MNALSRKLLRDVWRTRAQVASIAMVLAGGVLCVMSIRGAASSLVRARDDYYARAHFADVFATLTRAPNEVAGRLATIPGVARLATRVVKDVRLDVPGLDRPAIGRLIALPVPGDAAERINTIDVLRGRAIAPGADDEVLASGRFMEANHLRLGDTLTAVINERRARVVIVGVGAAPDYLYEGAGAGMANDERSFAILWASSALVTDATGMRGAFNDVAIALTGGAREAAVIAAVDSVLTRYGGRGAIGRDHQLSHRVVNNELQQLDVMGLAFPTFFVGVAAFLAGTVLTRLVATEREQIAVLKAFGYTNAAVARHYLAYATIAVLLGVSIGVGLGVWLGRRFTALYADILRIPGLHFHVDWLAMTIALSVLSLATLAGAARAVLGAARLSPATALQSPAPTRYRTLLLDRVGLGSALPAAARMVLRGMERRPSRALLGAAGVAAALGMMSGSLSLYDASRRMIEVQFRIGHRETLAVQLVAPVPAAMRSRFAALAGVSRVELTHAIPVRLHHGGRSRTLALTGVETGSVLYRLVDVEGRTRAIPPDGVALSASLATALDVTGDRPRHPGRHHARVTEVHRRQHARGERARPFGHTEHGAGRVTHDVQRRLVVHRAIQPTVAAKSHDDQRRIRLLGCPYDRIGRSAEHDANGPVDVLASDRRERRAHRVFLRCVNRWSERGVSHRQHHVEHWRRSHGSGIDDRDHVNGRVVRRRERLRDVCARERAWRTIGREHDLAAAQVEARR